MSDDIHIEKIKELAKQFRMAIESTDMNERPKSFKKFPQGSCGDTCEMLGAYYIDHGLGKFEYIMAERGDAHSYQSHGWLLQGSIIVDITADQFNEGVGKIIVSENSKWHNNTWTTKPDPRIADFRNDHIANNNLHTFYQRIISKIN